MKYKVEKGTPLFDAFDDVYTLIKYCNTKALELSESLGFKEFGSNTSEIAGGIYCFYSEEKKEGYKTVGKPYQNLIFPKAQNKELLLKIAELPVVKLEQYNELISFKQRFSSDERGLIHIRSFGSQISNCGNYYLLDIDPKSDFEIKEGMIEILESEYIRLSNKKSNDDVK